MMGLSQGEFKEWFDSKASCGGARDGGEAEAELMRKEVCLTSFTGHSYIVSAP